MPNREIAERYIEASRRGDVEGALACFAPGAEFVGPMGRLPFPDGVRAYLGGFAASFPGARFEVGNTVEAGDDVAVEGVWVGTHSGPLALPDGTSVPPTGREARGPFAIVFRVRDGRIESHRGYWDLAGFMAQLTAP
jgi:ketosteroid isomerase-like protein